jgi:heptose I phosphotransferase
MKLELPKDFNDIMSIKGKVYSLVKTRETLRFTLQNKAYFIKKHFGVGYKELLKNLLQFRLPIFGAENEYQAIKKLKQLDIPTMTLAGYGRSGFNPIKRQSFVITEELSNMVSLENACKGWLQNPPSFILKKTLIKKTADIARTLHNSGLNHRDFYICHFLWNKSVSDPILYLIDLHRVQIRKKTPMRWRIKDIAGLYFSSMNIGLTKRDLLRFIRYYFAQPWQNVLKDYKKFLHKVEKRAKKLYEKTNIIKERSWKGFMLCDKNYFNKDMRSLLANPDRFIINAEKLKAGTTCTTAKINLDNRELVIKRFNIKSFGHLLKRLFRPSRAIRCWRNAHMLLDYKIMTPKPIAILEKRFGPLRTKAYFITEYVAGETADDYFDTSKKILAQKMVKTLLSLQHKCIKYNDSKANNFIIAKQNVYLTDLDGMRKYCPLRYKLTHAFEKDKARFIRSWENKPDIKQMFLELFDKMLNLPK